MGKQTCFSPTFCPLESLFNAVPRNQVLHKAAEMVQFIQYATGMPEKVRDWFPRCHREKVNRVGGEEEITGKFTPDKSQLY